MADYLNSSIGNFFNSVNSNIFSEDSLPVAVPEESWNEKYKKGFELQNKEYGAQSDTPWIRDISTLDDIQFNAKYGQDAPALKQKASEYIAIAKSAQAATENGILGGALDATGTAAQTAVSAMGSALAFPAVLAGAADSSNTINKKVSSYLSWVDGLARSIGDSIRTDTGAERQKLADLDSEVQQAASAKKEAQDIANGKSSFIAGLERLGRDTFQPFIHHGAAGVADNMGVLFGSAVGFGGAGKLTSTATRAGAKMLGAKMASREALEAAAKAGTLGERVAGENLLGQAVRKVTTNNYGIGAATAEGGSMFGGEVEKLQNDPRTSIENLYKNSPEFVKRVKTLMDDGMSKAQAEEKARESIIYDTALVPSLASAAGGALFSGAFKKFLPGAAGAAAAKNANSSVASRFMDSVKGTAGSTTVGAIEATSTNVGEKLYVDKNKDMLEGVGKTLNSYLEGGLGLGAVSSLGRRSSNRSSASNAEDSSSVPELFNSESSDSSVPPSAPPIPPSGSSESSGAAGHSSTIEQERAAIHKQESAFRAKDSVSAEDKEASVNREMEAEKYYKDVSDSYTSIHTVNSKDPETVTLEERRSALSKVSAAQEHYANVIDQCDAAIADAEKTNDSAKVDQLKARKKVYEKEEQEFLQAVDNQKQLFKAQLDKERESYTETLTPEQLKNEQTYLLTSVNTAKNLEEVRDVFASYPKNIYDQVKAARSSDKVSSDGLTSLDAIFNEGDKVYAELGDKAVNIPLNKPISESPQETVTPPSTAQVEPKKVTTPTVSTETVTPEKPAATTTAPATPATVAETPKEKVSTTDTKLEKPSEKEEKSVSEPESEFSEDQQKALADVEDSIQAIRDLDEERNEIFRAHRAADNTIKSRSGKGLYGKVKTHFKRRARRKFTEQQLEEIHAKAKALKETLDKRIAALNDKGISVSINERGELEFTPRENNSQIEEQFKSKFGERFSNFFAPVKRGFYLWFRPNSSKSTLEALSDFVKDISDINQVIDAEINAGIEDVSSFAKFRAHLNNKLKNSNVFKYFQSQGLQDGIRVARSLSKGSTSEITSRPTEGLPNPTNQSLVDQVLTALNPQGALVKAFDGTSLVTGTIEAGSPLTISGLAVKNSEGKYVLNSEIQDVAKIAAIQWLAMLGVLGHSLNEEELRRLNIDPVKYMELQDSSDTPVTEDSFTTKEVPTDSAMLNLVTTLRKCLGISIANNNNSIAETEAILGQLASIIANSALEADLIQKDTHPQLKVTKQRNDGTTEEVPLSVVRVNDALRSLFKQDRQIILKILDPKYTREVFVNKVPPVKKTVAHSDLNNSALGNQALENANSQGYSVNMPLVNLYTKIGAPRDIASLWGEVPSLDPKDPINSHFNKNDRTAKLSRLTQLELAVDYLNTVKNSLLNGEAFNNAKLYFSNVLLRNGRIMQEGSVTPQNNKDFRYLVLPRNSEPLNLTTPKKGEENSDLIAWKATIAQTLGEKIGEKVGTYIANVDSALAIVDSILANSSEITDLVKSCYSTEEAKPSDSLKVTKKFIKTANEAFEIAGLSYKIKDSMGLNTLLEMAKYSLEKNNPDALKQFTSNLVCEIDGKNNGPSNEKTLYAVSVKTLSKSFFDLNARTGKMYLLDCSLQELSTDELSGSDTLYKSSGKDIYTKVSEESVPQYLAQAVTRLNAVKGSSKGRADNVKSALSSLLTILNELGLISNEFNPENFIKNPENRSNWPVFDKLLAKKMTMIIPYGSKAHGASEQIVSLFLVRKFYEAISENLQNSNAQSAKIVKVRDALTKLLSQEFSSVAIEGERSYASWHKTSKSSTENLEKLKKQENADLSEVQAFAKTKYWGFSSGRFDGLPSEIHSFTFTPEQLRILANNIEVLLGRMAYTAVSETIGEDAKKGSEVVMGVGGLLTTITRGMENLIVTPEVRKTRTTSEKYKTGTLLKRFSPLIQYRSGVQVFAERSSYVNNQAPLVKDPKGNFNYYSSATSIASSGISFGALAMQGIGDASMAHFIHRNADGSGVPVFGSIFDGMYVSPNLIDKMEKLANQGVAESLKEHIASDLLDTLTSVGNTLIAEGIIKTNDPREAVIQALCNIAHGDNIDGSKKIKGSSEDLKGSFGDNIANDIRRSLETILYDLTYTNDLLNPAKRQSGQLSRVAPNKLNIGKTSPAVEEIRDHLHQMFDQLDAMEMAENIHKNILESLPQTMHHMSALGNAEGRVSLNGKGLTLQQAKDLLKELNSISEGRFDTFGDVSLAIVNSLKESVFNKLYPDATEHEKALFEQIKASDKLEKAIVLSPAERAVVQKYLPNLFENVVEKAVETKAHPSNVPGSKKISAGFIKSAFFNLAPEGAHRGLYKSIYTKIAHIIPDNMSITLVKDISELPEEIQAKFSYKDQDGLYIASTNEVYLIDKSGKMDITHPSNLEVLCHETIHIVTSRLISNYYNDKGSLLTEIQKEALDNLDKLIQDFNSLTWDGVMPPAIEHLKNILSSSKSPAEKMDEALAYILTNEDVLNALAKSKMTEDKAKEHKQLLASLLAVARYVWTKLLSIVNGSSLDTALNNSYLHLFGSNTLVFLNEESNKTFAKKKPNKTTNSTETSNTTRAHRSANINRGYTYSPKSFNSESIEQVLRDKLSRSRMPNKIRVSPGKEEAYNREIQKRIDNAVELAGNYVSKLQLSLENVIPEHAQEVAKTVLALLGEDLLNATDRDKITKLYLAAKKHITVENLVKDANDPVEVEKATHIAQLLDLDSELWQDIFSTMPKETSEFIKKEFEKPAIFFTLCNSIPEVKEYVQNLEIPSYTTSSEKTGSTLSNFITSISDTINSRLNNEIMGQGSIVDTVNSIISARATLLGMQTGPATINAVKSAFNLSDQAAIGLVLTAPRFILQTIKKVAPGETIKGFASVGTYIIKGMEYQSRLSSEVSNAVEQRDFAAEGLRKWVLRTFTSPKVIDFFKEFYGNTPSLMPFFNLLKKIRGVLDKDRVHIIESIPKNLESAFKHNTITRVTKKLFDRALGATDLSCLSNTDAEKFLSDDSARKAEISRLEDSLKVIDKTKGNTWIAKAKQLSGYIMGVSEAGHNLLPNAEAIAKNFGAISTWEVDKATIADIDKLITLYNIENLSKEDRTATAKFYEKDKDAMNGVLDLARSIKAEESRRCNSEFLIRSFKGYRPKGTQAKCHYRLVNAEQLKVFEKLGYKTLGKYEASNIDPSEPMYRVVSYWPHPREYIEGMIQNINPTANGYNIDDKTRGEAEGTKLTVSDGEKVFKNFDIEAKGNSVIPIYNSKGDVVAYERSIPLEDRKYLEESNDYFSALAQYTSRQERELAAKEINKQAIDICKNDWDTATPEERKSEFVDLFNSKDITYQEAVARFNSDVLKEIRNRFGGNHFYVRKDLVWTVVGFRRASVTDVWEGKSILPAHFEKVVIRLSEAILGKKAMHYLASFETFVQGVASYARETIIIRSVTVPLMNITGNALLAHIALGMPIKDIWSYSKKAIAYTEQYQKLIKERIEKELEKTRYSDGQHQKELDAVNRRIADIDLEISNNPLYRLIQEGEFSTISSQGKSYEEVDMLKQKFGDFLEAATQKIPKGARTGMANLLMTKESEAYQVLSKMVNYGDWIAKGACYLYLTETSSEASTKQTHEAAKHVVSTLFVDYDQFAGRTRDYLNRIGATWFMTFKYRMFPAAMLSFLMNPSRMIVGSAFSSYAGLAGTPLTDNIVSKLLTGDLWYSAGWSMMLRGIGMHPLAILLGAMI